MYHSNNQSGWKTLNSDLANLYNDQVRKSYLPLQYANMPLEEVKAVANQNEAQLLYVEGGLFTDCCTERCVMNVCLSPRNTLLNFLPFQSNNNQIVKFQYLTNITGLSSDRPVTPCEDGPTVGELEACMGQFRKGRIKISSNTMEMDAIIQRLCDGISNDLFLLGDTRGVSFSPSPSQMDEIRGNTDLLNAGVVRRQLHLIGKELQLQIAKQLWSGEGAHPITNAAGPRDTAGGGWKEFTGLLSLVADNYGNGGQPGITGSNCEALNADIKDFDGCLGTNPVSIYQYLSVLEDTLWQRATGMGYSSVEWVIVMPPGMWSKIVEIWPCQALTYGCNALATAPAGVPQQTNVVVNTDGNGMRMIQRTMQNTRTLEINGRTYPVIVDDILPVTQSGTPGNLGPDSVQYTSSIFMIPLRVDGEPVTYVISADYRALAPILGSIGDDIYTSRGWSDSGVYLHDICSKSWCFNVGTKMEVGLVFKAPFLSGRIDNICWERLQPNPVLKGSMNPTIVP